MKLPTKEPELRRKYNKILIVFIFWNLKYPFRQIATFIRDKASFLNCFVMEQRKWLSLQKVNLLKRLFFFTLCKYKQHLYWVEEQHIVLPSVPFQGVVIKSGEFNKISILSREFISWKFPLQLFSWKINKIKPIRKQKLKKNKKLNKITSNFLLPTHKIVHSQCPCQCHILHTSFHKEGSKTFDIPTHNKLFSSCKTKSSHIQVSKKFLNREKAEGNSLWNEQQINQTKPK